MSCWIQQYSAFMRGAEWIINPYASRDNNTLDGPGISTLQLTLELCCSALPEPTQLASIFNAIAALSDCSFGCNNVLCFALHPLQAIDTFEQYGLVANNSDKAYACLQRSIAEEHSSPWIYYTHASNETLRRKRNIFVWIYGSYLCSRKPLNSPTFFAGAQIYLTVLSPQRSISGSIIKHLSSRKSVKLATAISSLFFICVLHSRRVAESNFAIIKWLISVSHVLTLRDSNARICCKIPSRVCCNCTPDSFCIIEMSSNNCKCLLAIARLSSNLLVRRFQAIV